MEAVLLEMAAQRLELFGDREAPLGEVGVEMAHEGEEDRVVAHALTAVHGIPVDSAVVLPGVLLEVQAEPLRGVGLPRPHGAVQERVARRAGLDDGAHQAEQPLRLLLPVDHLLGKEVEGQFSRIPEDGRSGAEGHEGTNAGEANKGFAL